MSLLLTSGFHKLCTLLQELVVIFITLHLHIPGPAFGLGGLLNIYIYISSHKASHLLKGDYDNVIYVAPYQRRGPGGRFASVNTLFPARVLHHLAEDWSGEEIGHGRSVT